MPPPCSSSLPARQPPTGPSALTGMGNPGVGSKFNSGRQGGSAGRPQGLLARQAPRLRQPPQKVPHPTALAWTVVSVTLLREDREESFQLINLKHL